MTAQSMAPAMSASSAALPIYEQVAGAAAGAADALRDIERERIGLPTDASKLFVMGGQDRQVFLGCLNCGETDRDSITNPMGRFGSPVSRLSIANPISEYGSPVRATSACNPVASRPPLVVTGTGKVLGELTSNEARRGRITDANIVRWLASVCSSQ